MPPHGGRGGTKAVRLEPGVVGAMPTSTKVGSGLPGGMRPLRDKDATDDE